MRCSSADYIGASEDLGQLNTHTQAGYKAAADSFTTRCGLLLIAGRHPYKLSITALSHALPFQLIDIVIPKSAASRQYS